MMGLGDREGEGESGEREWEGCYLDFWHSCDHVPVSHSSPPILSSTLLFNPLGKISRGELKSSGTVRIFFLPSAVS